ncbi:hypothetical protein ACQKL0_11700 [Peribacillus sp. NPDC097264]|uniref:hypothetical protein n=1 Tax=Peribacillus sp. NPDC097264 TaxID=3390616 RepID=UPI003D00459E
MWLHLGSGFEIIGYSFGGNRRNGQGKGAVKIKTTEIPEPKLRVILALAIILESIFFIGFFTGILSNLHVYIGAATGLLIGFVSLLISAYLLAKKSYGAISLCILFFSVLITFFTFVAYFLPEAGYPPPIRLFF